MSELAAWSRRWAGVSWTFVRIRRTFRLYTASNILCTMQCTCLRQCIIYGKGKLNFHETKEVSSVLNTLRNNVNDWVTDCYLNFIWMFKTKFCNCDDHNTESVAYPGIFFGRGRGSTNSVDDRGRRSGGGSALVRGSGGSCNLVQEISFHIVKFS